MTSESNSSKSSPCECTHLSGLVQDSDSPISQDQQTGGFTLNWRSRQGTNFMQMIFCPFCGGTLPLEKSDCRFAIISPEELARLRKLVEPIHSINDAQAAFGQPDDKGAYTDPMGLVNGVNPTYRTHIYKKLSTVADIQISESAIGLQTHINAKWLPIKDAT